MTKEQLLSNDPLQRANTKSNEVVFQTNESPYLFLDPERLLRTEEKELLRKMTVATVAPPYLPIPPEDYGGTENVTYNNARSKAASFLKNHKVFALGNSGIQNISNVELHPSVKREETPDELITLLRTNPSEAAKAALHHVIDTYTRLAEMPEVQVIHDHTDVGPSQALRLGRATLVTQHGPVDRKLLQKHAADYLEAFQDVPYMWSIAISQDQLDSNPNLRWLGVIHNGVDLADFEFKIEKGHREKGYDELGQYGLFMGRICEAKGVEEAIDTAEAVDMPLIIAGPIEDQKYFNEKILPRIEANPSQIMYTGPADKEERRILMANASWFSMLNRWKEPFGMVVAEAMASGTPVIATRKGAIPEIIGKVGGILVDDPKDAQDAVRKILNESSREKQRRAFAARRRVEMKFSTDVMAAKYALAYIEALARVAGKSKQTGIMHFPDFAWAEKEIPQFTDTDYTHSTISVSHS